MTISPEQVGLFVGCLLILIPLFYFIQKLSGKPESRNITPQPLEVKASPRYMTEENCEKFHEQQAENFQRMIYGSASDFRAILQQELRKMEELHSSRTDEFRKELNAQIGGVHRRVDLIFRALKPGVSLDE